MSGEINTHITGNLTADPERREANGKTIASFTIAANSQYVGRDGQAKDGGTVFMRCTAWGQLAEHILDTCTKGMRVVATGQLRQQSWQDEQGGKHSRIELNVTDFGPSLLFATAQVNRIQQPRNGYQGYGMQNNASQTSYSTSNSGYQTNYGTQTGGGDPWAAAAQQGMSTAGDEPEF